MSQIELQLDEGSFVMCTDMWNQNGMFEQHKNVFVSVSNMFLFKKNKMYIR